MAEPTVRKITLSNLADGAAEELFGAALERVLENIDDPNTDPEAKRTITLACHFKVDEERRVGSIELSCSTKLAGVKGITTGIYLGRHQGVLTVVEAPKQEDLFPNPAARPRAVTAPATGTEA